VIEVLAVPSMAIHQKQPLISQCSVITRASRTVSATAVSYFAWWISTHLSSSFDSTWHGTWTRQISVPNAFCNPTRGKAKRSHNTMSISVESVAKL